MTNYIESYYSNFFAVSTVLVTGLLMGFYFGYFKITTTESKTIFTKIELLELEREIKSLLKESDSFVITD